MNWQEASYSSSELEVVGDELNRCKENKILTELELDNEEFKRKYITKRKELTAGKATIRMICIIIVFFILAFCLVILTNDGDISSIISIIALVITIIFCFIIFVKLLLPEVKLLAKFNSFSKNTDADKGIVSFEKEIQLSEQKIKRLKLQLELLNKDIENLLAKKEAILNKEALARNHSSFQEEKEATNSFSIKKDTLSNIQVNELIKDLEKEILSDKEKLEKLKKEDTLLKDNIIDIEKDFLIVKNKCLNFILTVAILTFLHNIFSGVLYIIAGVVLGVFLIVYFARLVHICKKPVILYLVEHKHKNIQDYAYVNDLKPLCDKRKEIADETASLKRNIDHLENKIFSYKEYTII